MSTMIDSFIYDNIQSGKQRRLAGYFKPSTKWSPIDSTSNYVMYLDNAISISKDTLVIYYSGSFGQFHEGHLNVVERAIQDAKQITDNYVIVISPTNSDYCVSKYGAYSNLSSNKERTNNIKKIIEERGLTNVVIDINAMLNHYSDQNFTDLLQYFINHNCNVKSLTELTHIPVLVGGKDRDYRSITKHTDLVGFWFYEEEVARSTSTDTTNIIQDKKNLVLRVNNISEYDIFVSLMGQYYKSISYIMIDGETNRVSKMDKDKCITICKDYSHILEYIPLSREYETPLSEPKHNIQDRDKFLQYKGKVVIDSDIFSGGTKDFIETVCGLRMEALIDLRHTNVELLDIDDFKKPDFRYPYVDLSSKCSLPAFTYKEHYVIIELHKQLTRGK